MSRLLLAFVILVQLPSNVGALYVLINGSYQPIPKVVAKVSGRITISGEIRGASAEVRLPAGQLPQFRICGVDPTRYKLYVMKVTKNARTLAISQVGFFGGGKSVLQSSEIDVTIQSADANCYAISPKEALDRGEYGFSPVDSNDVFAFGIGDAKKP